MLFRLWTGRSSNGSVPTGRWDGCRYGRRFEKDIPMKSTPTILIVEDDENHRFMLDVILRSWGCVTQKARNGRGALPLIQHKEVDLVLMDINLAQDTGIDVLRRLRSFDPYLPVILMTAYCPPETAREASDLAGGEILVKPIRLDQLEEVIHRVLGQTVISSTSAGG